jgi:hypothetical protein
MLIALSSPLEPKEGYGASAEGIFAGQTKPIPTKHKKN